MFFSISFLFLGYLIVLTFPICILMTIDPKSTPLSKGFYYILSTDLLFDREYSYPKSFLIQFYISCMVLGLYYPITSVFFFSLAPYLSTTMLGDYFLWFYLPDYSLVLAILFFRLWLVLRLWLILKFIKSPITLQNIYYRMLPISTYYTIASTFCFGILSHSSK